MPDRDAIVGRDAHLAALEGFLQAGTGTLILEGEPGIGKSTLWRAGVELAGAQRRRVLRAQPSEPEAAFSYAALADLLEDAYDGVAAELPLPQRRSLDAALLRDDGRTDPRAAGVAAAGVLRLLAADCGLLLAIDDVQWLDAASRTVLAYALRRVGGDVMLLLARRPTGEGPPTVEPVEVVTVGPLSTAAIHHVLALHLGWTPRRPLLTRIADTSGGNPFFALELARPLRDDAAGPPLRLPATVEEVVSVHLSALSPAARAAALSVAAQSRPRPGTVDAGAAALAEAEAAGILLVRPDRIEFAHPLLAAAVYGGATGAERLELHRRLAAAATDPEERGRHLALSAGKPDEEVAAAVEAGAAAAARRGAQEAAAELARAAQALTPSDAPAALARRLRREAEALLAAGDADGARAAAERARRGAAGSELAEVELVLSQIAWLAPDELGPLGHLEQALAHAGDDRRLRGRIHSKLAALSDADQRRAVEHADAALSLLDEATDPGLLAYVLATRLFFGAQTGHGADETLLRRGLELEARAGHDSERSSLYLIWLQSLDRPEEARARHDAEDEWYRDRGEEGWRAEKLAHRAVVEFNAGEWDRAEALIDESCAVMATIGSEGPWAMPLWTRSRFDAHRGRVERARATVEPLLAELKSRNGGSWFLSFPLEALGQAALAAGEPDAAAAAFAEMDSVLAAVGVTVPLPVRGDADHVEACVLLGELDRARALVTRLEARGRSVPRPWIDVALPRARALVLAAEGEVDEALLQLGEAPVVAPVPFELARNLLVRGSLERRAKRRRDAAATLDAAAAAFAALGAPDWERRARDERARVGLRRGDRDELTETELRIAELVASGLTNREAARAAFVSPKTVEANLARVYRKLGVRSRAELGAVMAARAKT